MTNARTNDRTFSASIIEASRELTPVETVKMKDTKDAQRLDAATADGPITFNPVMYAILAIHNEKSDDKDYEQYLIVDSEGNKYVTGSQSFWNAFMDIWADLQDLTEKGEPWSLKVYQIPSKNYQGRNFLSCSLA